MATFPKDQFDNLPEDLTRQGAHRAPKKRGGGWLGFLASIVATAVLIVGGLYGVSLVNDSIEFTIPGFASGEDPAPEPTVSATPEVAPILDPADIDKKRKITITVLNGTAVSGLETVAGKSLTKGKWPVASTAPSSSTDIEKTFVYYKNPEDEDVARGLVIALGIGEIRESDKFLGAPITIVVGQDYADLQ
jgi:hypothetical protein